MLRPEVAWISIPAPSSDARPAQAVDENDIDGALPWFWCVQNSEPERVRSSILRPLPGNCRRGGRHQIAVDIRYVALYGGFSPQARKAIAHVQRVPKIAICLTPGRLIIAIHHDLGLRAPTPSIFAINRLRLSLP